MPLLCLEFKDISVIYRFSEHGLMIQFLGDDISYLLHCLERVYGLPDVPIMRAREAMG